MTFHFEFKLLRGNSFASQNSGAVGFKEPELSNSELQLFKLECSEKAPNKLIIQVFNQSAHH